MICDHGFKKKKVETIKLLSVLSRAYKLQIKQNNQKLKFSELIKRISTMFKFLVILDAIIKLFS